MSPAAQERVPFRTVLAFTLVYLTASAWHALATGNVEFTFYVIVLVILIGIIGFVYRVAQLSTGVLWCLSLWGLLHMLGGLMPVPASWPTQDGGSVLYTWWLIPDQLKYDNVVHAFGFGVATWVCWQGLAAAFRNRGLPVRPTLGLMVLVWAAGLGLGAINEVVEFFATLTIPETNVGGYLNTGWDLVANLVGATLTVTLIYLRRPREADPAG